MTPSTALAIRLRQEATYSRSQAAGYRQDADHRDRIAAALEALAVRAEQGDDIDWTSVLDEFHVATPYERLTLDLLTERAISPDRRQSEGGTGIR